MTTLKERIIDVIEASNSRLTSRQIFDLLPEKPKKIEQVQTTLTDIHTLSNGRVRRFRGRGQRRFLYGVAKANRVRAVFKRLLPKPKVVINLPVMAVDVLPKMEPTNPAMASSWLKLAVAQREQADALMAASNKSIGKARELIEADKLLN